MIPVNEGGTVENTLVKSAPETSEIVLVAYELRVADRCDRCSAQAFFVAHKVSGDKQVDLLFCGHHGREAEPALIAQGFSIQNETHRINIKPTDPDADNF